MWFFPGIDDIDPRQVVEPGKIVFPFKFFRIDFRCIREEFITFCIKKEQTITIGKKENIFKQVFILDH